MEGNRKLIIYDGVCNLCDASVKLILEQEKKPTFTFTHLTSHTGLQIKNKFQIKDDFDGILLLENDKLYLKSAAAYRISRYLKFPFSVFQYFRWIPTFISDGLYDYIAKNRYKWFGKDDCLIPDQRFKNRFI